jgi:hypothetical protein
MADGIKFGVKGLIVSSTEIGTIFEVQQRFAHRI